MTVTTAGPPTVGSAVGPLTEPHSADELGGDDGTAGAVSADTAAPDLLDEPDLLGEVAQLPVVLAAYAGLEQAVLDHGTFDHGIRTAIAVVVGAVRNCADCQAEQIVAARAAGWSSTQIVALRTGEPSAGQGALTALLAVARQVVRNRGSVSQQAWQEALRAGWSRRELAELFVHVVTGVFTDCLNHYARVEIDLAGCLLPQPA